MVELEMPESIPANEVIGAIMEFMDGEDTIAKFADFLDQAIWTDEELETMTDEEMDEDDSEYCVALQKGEMVIGTDTVKGYIVSAWSGKEAPPSDRLPAQLSRDRHSRFLLIDEDAQLIVDMHLLPTLH